MAYGTASKRGISTGNGYIPISTLKEILHELDAKLTDQELEGICKEIDEDGSGTVDFDGSECSLHEGLIKRLMTYRSCRVHGHDDGLSDHLHYSPPPPSAAERTNERTNVPLFSLAHNIHTEFSPRILLRASFRETSPRNSHETVAAWKAIQDAN